MGQDDRRGGLERWLANLTIGVAMSVKDREHNLLDTRVGEWENQVRQELSGLASTTWAFVDRDVAFYIPLMSAPQQRMNPLMTPHFTHGVEFVQNGGALVVIVAHVIGWKINEVGWDTGGAVGFGALSPS